MTSDEIANTKIGADEHGDTIEAALLEIAYQLAKLNEKLDEVMVRDGTSKYRFLRTVVLR